MSTKIYTGFRVAKNLSWDALHTEVMAFRKELSAVVRDETHEHLVRSAVLNLDRIAVGLDSPHQPGESSPWSHAVVEWIEERDKSPNKFDVAFMPHGGRIYGMTFGDNRYNDLWRKKSFIEDYTYWNNTDRPDNLSAAEWTRRRKTWDAILPGCTVPAMAGFIAQCIERYPGFPRLRDAIGFVPKFDCRVRTIATEIVYAQQVDNDPSVDPMRIFMGLPRWLKSKEGAARFEVETERARMLLAPEVTEDMLNGQSLPSEGAKTDGP